MDNGVVIDITNVKKTFKLPVESSSSLKSTLINRLNGIKGYQKQKVLDGISFKVEKGDFFGIVGKNGSGKSTLLKILSQIYVPDSGTVKVAGKLVPFIELGVGFNPELTGRENVYLNGAMFGFSTEEIDNMYEEIVRFAELENFMKQKLKNYSSGMQVRLAFSVAIKAKGDILVLDEVLAVGDEAFSRKCNEYFQSMKESGRTVVLVTHDMSSVKKFCNKAILIRSGKVAAFGNPEDVANQYSLDNFKTCGEKKTENEEFSDEQQKYPIGLSKLVPFFRAVPFSNVNRTSSDGFICDFEYEVTKDIDVALLTSLIDENGTSGSVIDGGLLKDNLKYFVRSTTKGKHKVRWEIPLHYFNNRKFRVEAVLYQVVNDEGRIIAFTGSSRAARFMITGNVDNSALLKESGSWLD